MGLVLRMSHANPQEKQVCRLARELATDLCNRVFDIHMHGLELPMQYVVNLTTENGKPVLLLCRIGADGVQWPVNEADPAVEPCLQFYKDVRMGLISQVEEMYCKRVREFARAALYLQAVLVDGIEKLQQEPDLDNLDDEGEDTDAANTDPTGGRMEKLEVHEAPGRRIDI